MHTDATPNEGLRRGRIRRTHSAEFKAQVVAACGSPGVSSAAVAMAHGINANLARRWVVQAQSCGDSASMAGVKTAMPAFVPVQLSAPAPAPADIRIELHRGPVAISVSWPCGAASECATWMRELLR